MKVSESILSILEGYKSTYVIATFKNKSDYDKACNSMAVYGELTKRPREFKIGATISTIENLKLMFEREGIKDYSIGEL